MSLSERDIKLLWGRSGNRCAICRKELAQDKASAKGAFLLGEHAHIVGEKTGSPRGDSLLNENERNGYHNRILLCPNDHTVIDKNEADWPVEKLHMIKTDHEIWVQQTLSEVVDNKKLADQEVVASIIDEAVEKCRLYSFDTWISNALATDPQWSSTLPDSISEFREKVIRAVWPEGFEELRLATETFSILIDYSARLFTKNCDETNDILIPFKFYKAKGWNPSYDEDLKKYENWLKTCHEYLQETIKAANWFATVVRRDINPRFFAVQGKFIVTDGSRKILEYSETERAGLPDSLNLPDPTQII